jgi:hypothetical protein
MAGAKPEGQAPDIADSIMAAAASPKDKLSPTG